MARAATARSTETPSPELALPLFGEWFESQQRVATVALGQWSGWQELWLRSVYQQLDLWNAMWRLDGAEADAARNAPTAWTELPAAVAETMQRTTQAWWGPWLPALQRGSEQLA